MNLLAYQHGAHDRFYYRYKYDAENRLTCAYSSTTANIDPYGFRSTINEGDLRLDASYQYYLHGPLARVELGNTSKIVQGLDYVYTLQGWLKGVNGNKLSGGTADVGQDQANVAKDALAYSLGYYSGDYLPVGGSSSSAFAMNYQPGGDAIGLNLYNGNISNSTYAIANVQGGNTAGYTYQYDQLNRLKKLRQHNLSSANGTWDNSTVNTDHYSEAFDYDGNGNILALKRNAAGTTMDQLAYGYSRGSDGKLLNNKLSVLSDAIGGSAHSGELTGSTNYGYDAIGNLITDSKEGITGIDWTVYGKIGKISKTNAAENITYGYDPTGNRVSKTINGLSTWYVRDAQGNSLAVYDNKSGGTNWREQQLYGSSRLGMWKPNFNLASDSAGIKWNYTGLKFFELSNHLGNVMSVINDERTLTGGEYTPTVMNAQDYYAFGSVMPGRDYTLTGSSAYRYGFNGKENDNEVKGTGNQQDYGMRIYDPRIGKFLSVDPLTKSFPWYTPYQFAGNTPIEAIDLDGLEEFHTQQGDVTPYTRKPYQGSLLNKVDAYLYNSLVAPFYNLSSFAINKTTQVVTRPKEASRDAGKGMVDAVNYLKEGLTTPVTWGDVKTGLTDPANYEAAPLMVLGLRSVKPKMAVTTATTVSSDLVTVGQWMSAGEFEAFQKTGIIPRTNVLTKGAAGYEGTAAVGDIYAEFSIYKSLLVEKNAEKGWSLIKSKNEMYKKLAEKKGETLPAPKGLNIEKVKVKE